MNSFEYTNRFKEIIEYGKNLKSDIVFIQGNTIYGADSGFNYLKSISFENDINLTIIYEQKKMNDLMKVSTDTIVYKDNIVQSGTDFLYVNIPTYYSKFLGLIDRVDSLLRFNNTTLTVDNLRGQEEFENLINLKTSQGMGLFRVGEYILTIFKNLIPVNKKDIVRLDIKDLYDGRFLSTFTIIKPKNIIITVNILYLKIK